MLRSVSPRDAEWLRQTLCEIRRIDTEIHMARLHRNIKLHQGTTSVTAMLEVAVNKLLAFNNNFQFEGFTAQDTVTTGFIIFDGVDQVGTIEYGNHQGKANAAGECEPAFAVGSPNVKKERGNRGKIITTDVGAAVRHAKKLMSKPDIKEIVESIAVPVYRRIDSLTDRHTHKVSACWNLNSHIFASWLAANLELEIDHNGEGKVVGLEKLNFADIPKEAQFTIDTEIFAAYYRRTTLLAMKEDAEKAVADGRGAYAIRLRGDGVRVVCMENRNETDPAPEGAATIGTVRLSYGVHVSNVFATMTDYPNLELAPNWVKEKVATLTLAEVDHAIPNIGIKVQSDKNVDMFFIYRKQVVEDETHEDANAV